MPWQKWKDYYLPQIETNMAVFDCDFAYLMCWTPQQATLFYYERTPYFWHEVCCSLWHAGAPCCVMTTLM